MLKVRNIQTYYPMFTISSVIFINFHLFFRKNSMISRVDLWKWQM